MRRIGILTGGGDAPGLNAVIRAFVKHGCGAPHEWEVVGIEESFNGLIFSPHGLIALDISSAQGLLHRGGTVLGTTNHGDPFAFSTLRGVEDVSERVRKSMDEENIEGLVVIGGDGTMRIARRLMDERGVPVIGVPKTIDNDLSATDYTFGFQSAVAVATDALDRLHTTAESHDRVMFLEVMGRDVGHIALHSGVAGGADIILIPEIPYDPQRLVDKIHARRALGRRFSIIVVAEGALPREEREASSARRRERLRAGGGAAAIAMAQLQDRVQAEMRVTVLGHVQRGGGPIPFDRILATRFGVAAVDLVAQNRWGEMVRLKDGRVDGVPLAEAAITRPVALSDELVYAARATGVEFGG